MSQEPLPRLPKWIEWALMIFYLMNKAIFGAPLTSLVAALLIVVFLYEHWWVDLCVTIIVLVCWFRALYKEQMRQSLMWAERVKRTASEEGDVNE